MGHRRLSYLPKSQAWKNIVEMIGQFPSGEITTKEITQKTINQVYRKFDELEADSSVRRAFKFLIILSVSYQKENPKGYLMELEVEYPRRLDIYQIGRAVKRYMENEKGSLEHSALARKAVLDSINIWYKRNYENTISLFEDENLTERIFSKVSKGGGFSEITRIYFAKLTERYLHYYLDRAADQKINNLTERARFTKRLNEHVDAISKHAFETSKITQSYAAGWYNKRAINRIPTDQELEVFVKKSLGKIKTELIKESAA